ncbi:MAG: glutathione S-transferase N-terminal domain-containing protein [Rhodospirillales bacterium]|nr:glutathione S-transferase N-terminal domain-containing protein [Rhodospirillales bacterium]
MKLRYSPASPFVRKVRLFAAETGLDSRIELVATNPWAADTDLPNDNPICKVPTLIMDSGEALYDSVVICEYLDSLHGGRKRFPAEGAARWKALRLHALIDGILDAALVCRLESSMRPEPHRWPAWLERHQATVERGLDALEREAGSLSALDSIAEISAVCTLGYLDFRFPANNWRSSRPALAAWYQLLLSRASVAATAPHD